jgi:hypothetical protein
MVEVNDGYVPYCVAAFQFYKDMKECDRVRTAGDCGQNMVII